MDPRHPRHPRYPRQNFMDPRHPGTQVPTPPTRFTILVAKRLDKKNEVNFKFYDATAWLSIVIHILSNSLRSNGNQTMKFGQLI